MNKEFNQKAKPRVLVLLASFNGKKWIGEQLDSILAQESVTLQIQISDDASTDGTATDVLAKYSHDKRVRYELWDKPSGSAGANFRRLYRTADISGFDYVALADQDDIWDSQKLAVATDLLSRTDSDGYSCAVLSFWSDGRQRILAQDAKWRSADFLFEGAGQGCTFVIRRELFEQIQEFCVRHETAVAKLHYHDWLIYLLVRAWEKRWYFDQNSLMRYRQHGGNEIGARGSFGAIKRRLELISRGWYRDQIRAAIEIFKLANDGNRQVNYLSKLIERDDSISRRLAISIFVLKNGRRRRRERLVMVMSAMAGHL